MDGDHVLMNMSPDLMITVSESRALGPLLVRKRWKGGRRLNRYVWSLWSGPC